VDRFLTLVNALNLDDVRYLVIGVWAANYYARGASLVFHTKDRDLFLPADADNLVRCWNACDSSGLSLWSGDEPLDSPRDRWLAERVIERRAAVRAADDHGMEVDLSLVMADLEFEAVWSRRRTFTVDGIEISVARLADVVTAKERVGRYKDRLFLATHREALQELLDREAREPS
jgi:hypothetical protein